MTTSNQHHPWFEDLGEFEGLLECATPDLPAWDNAATVRAYQTFHWDAAPGLDSGQAFFHETTGVVVRFEGGLVAIELGDGDLQEALPDLIRVLHSLGWREAILHSAPHTFEALLTDIGSSIPAGLDFDVRAAQRAGIERSPEALRLMQHVQALTNGNSHQPELSVPSLGASPVPSQASDETSQLMATFASLGGGGDSLTAGSAGSLGIALDDDEELQIGGGSVRPGQVSLDEELPLPGNLGTFGGASSDFGMGVAVRTAGPAIGDGLDDAPVIPVLLEDEGPVEVAEFDGSAVTGTERDAAIELAPAAISVSAPLAVVEEEPARAPAVPVVDAPPSDLAPVAVQAPSPAALSAASPAAPSQEPMLEARAILTSATAGGPCFVIGNSVVAFSFPGQPITQETVSAHADAAGIGMENVIYIRPDNSDLPLRWDLLAEVDPAAPLSAEIVADLFHVPKKGDSGFTLLPSLLLALRRSDRENGIRDLLALACQGAESCRSLIEAQLPSAQPLFGSAYGQECLQQELQIIIQRLSSLALMTAGTAFIDVPNDQAESFSIRALAQGAQSRVIVVHVDELDAGLAVWIANSMAAVARRYMLADRFRPAPPPVRSVPAVDPAKIEEIGAGVGALLKQLKDLGLNIQATA